MLLDLMHHKCQLDPTGSATFWQPRLLHIIQSDINIFNMIHEYLHVVFMPTQHPTQGAVTQTLNSHLHTAT